MQLGPGSLRPKATGRPEALSRLAGQLQATASRLQRTSHQQTLRRSHDVLDAVTAAARVGIQAHTRQPGEAGVAAAKTEGWIAIPDAR